MTARVPQAWLEALADPANRLDFEMVRRSRVEPEWGFADRRLPEHLLYLVTANEMAGRVEGQPIRLGPGMLLWLDPEQRHTFYNVKPARPITVFHMRFRLRRGEADLPAGGGPRVVTEAGGLARPFTEMVEEARASEPHRNLRLRALLLGMIVQLDRRIEAAARGGPPRLTQLQRRRIERLAERKRFRAAPAELAAAVRLSEGYFRRVFRQTYGMSSRRWLVRRRIDYAAALLSESDLTIGELADRLGYGDIFEFSRQFKQIMGISPTAFRRRG